MRILRSVRLKLYGTQSKMSRLREFLNEYRRQIGFKCCKCGFIINADLNARRNILNRFLNGLYGAVFKTYSVNEGE